MQQKSKIVKTSLRWTVKLGIIRVCVTLTYYDVNYGLTMCVWLCFVFFRFQHTSKPLGYEIHQILVSTALLNFIMKQKGPIDVLKAVLNAIILLAYGSHDTFFDLSCF